MAVANAGNIAVTTLDDAFSAVGSKILVDSAGPLAVGGGYVGVGTFSLTDAEITALGAANDWATLIAGFAQFGATGKVADFAGIVTHNADSPLADGDAFVGNAIYVAIGNTPEASQGDATTAGAWLVYKSADSFGADNPLFSSSARLDAATNDQLLIGGVGAAVNYPDLGGDVGTLVLAGEGGFIIPEPSSALLFLGGLGSMIFIRRRR